MQPELYLFFFFSIKCVCMCLCEVCHVCVYVSRDQKRALDSKKLVSQAIVSCLTGVLRMKPRSSGRASSFLPT